MIISNYDHMNTVTYFCEKCGITGAYDITSLLTDNCAICVDIICDICGDSRKLYVLRCTDLAQADKLNGELESLKIKGRE